jgi:hypothetical protein
MVLKMSKQVIVTQKRKIRAIAVEFYQIQSITTTIQSQTPFKMIA